MFRSDRILWYANGIFGELGYAVPNLGDDQVTINSNVHYLVDVLGRNLSAVMQSPDVDLRTPPTINTLLRVSKLCTRARTILASRSVKAHEPEFEATHATPAPQVFNVFPVPYFRVRNHWIKEWAGYTLLAISEACQHTDNRKAYDISDRFAGVIGQYVHRILTRLAVELLGAPIDEARKLDYTIPESLFTGYDPSKFFTSTELIDTLPPVAQLPTEDDLVVLTDGIPATHLVNVQPWPIDMGLLDGTKPVTATGGRVSFANPPGP